MTTTSELIPTAQCPICRSIVPAGSFCGRCGAELVGPRRFRHILLRPREFAVAPGEPITLPVVVSSLFPHLARSARNPFRLALLVFAVGLAVFGLLHAAADFRHAVAAVLLRKRLVVGAVAHAAHPVPPAGLNARL